MTSFELVATRGQDSGRRFPLEGAAGVPWVIGRNPDCAVVLSDRSVSRQHARLEHERGSWWVVDLGSRNGLSIDGAKLASADRARLEVGAELLLGEVVLELRPLVPETQPARPPPAPPSARSQDLEWEEDVEADLARLGRAQPSAPSLASQTSSIADEIELEQDTGLAAAPLPTEFHRRPVFETPAPPAAAPGASTLESARAFEQQRLERLRSAQRAAVDEGLLTGDLSQQPVWVRALVALFVLVLAAGLLWSAFEGVRWLRS